HAQETPNDSVPLFVRPACFDRLACLSPLCPHVRRHPCGGTRDSGDRPGGDRDRISQPAPFPSPSPLPWWGPLCFPGRIGGPSTPPCRSKSAAKPHDRPITACGLEPLTFTADVERT